MWKTLPPGFRYPRTNSIPWASSSIPDGYRQNGDAGEPFADGDGTDLDLEVFKDGDTWKIRDTDLGYVFQGAGNPAYFTDPRMNPGGLDHVMETGDLLADGSVTHAWEDLKELGDQDFNDVVFDVETNYTVEVSFASEDAGYRNTYGWYHTETGEAEILVANVDTATNADLADFTATLSLTADEIQHLGFFLIPDGYDMNSGRGRPLADGDGTDLDLQVFETNGIWQVRDTDSGYVFEGASAPAYFTEADKNPAGNDHAMEDGDLVADSAVTHNWEDLPGLGGEDFDDVVFGVTLGCGSADPGTTSDDVLRGGPGNDTLTGGDGTDIFSFFATDTAFGGGDENTITDFKVGGADRILLDGYPITDVDQLTCSQEDGNAEISGFSGGTIILENFACTDLTNDDFIFLPPATDPTGLYFSADDGTTGGELWKVAPDGNVIQVADIKLGPDGSFPASFVALADEFYFSADDGVTGYELWKVASDGSVIQAADIRLGAGESLPGSAHRVLGRALFLSRRRCVGERAVEGGGGRQCDPGRRHQLRDDDFDPSRFTEFAHELFFSASDGTTGRELWKAAADSSIVPVANINPGPDGSGPEELTEFAGELYFSADDGTTGRELWKMAADSSVAPVANINPGPDGSGPGEFTEFAGELYFSADDGTMGREPWKVTVDGRAIQVADINPGPDGSGPFPFGFTEFAGELYFRANDGTTGFKLWKVMADSNAVPVADINPGGDFFLVGFTEFAGELYFPADDDTTGVELWKVAANGSVVLVADINPGSDSSNPAALNEAFTEFAGELYFAANDGTTGYEPWKVAADGSVVQVDDIAPGADGSTPVEFTVFYPYDLFV